MKLISIGSEFAARSNNRIGQFYDANGRRYDLPDIQHILESGKSVTIRPATMQEMAYYNEQLRLILKQGENHGHHQ